MIFIINTKITRTKIVPSKRQVLKPIKVIEGIKNSGNGALIRCTAVHTFTIYWSPWETVASWATVDLYLVWHAYRISFDDVRDDTCRGL